MSNEGVISYLGVGGSVIISTSSPCGVGGITCYDRAWPVTLQVDNLFQEWFRSLS